MKTQSLNVAKGLGLLSVFVALVVLFTGGLPSAQPGKAEPFPKNWLFCYDWRFFLGDVKNGESVMLDDSQWRMLDLPHDWAIEGKFSPDNPAGVGGGALPGGIGWYRKTFTVPESDSSKLTFIRFDGVYKNSEVWINGHYLGKRPVRLLFFPI